MSRHVRTRPAAPITMVAVASLVAGCAAPPPGPPLAEPPLGAYAGAPQGGAAPLSQFEARWRERAQTAERQNRLADAALAWEVLALLRPGRFEGELGAVRGRIASAYAERMQRGEQEMKRGSLERAEQAYLGALALRPGDADATGALRAVDRARNKRDFLGQASRLTAGKAQAAGQLDAALEREQIAALVSQGELDEAFVLLQSRLAAVPTDAQARAQMAQVCVKKAQGLLAQDAKGARAWLVRALQAVPEHAGALALMKQLPAGS